MAFSTALTEIYRSRPTRLRNGIMFTVVWEMDSGDLDEGLDGWVEGANDVPKEGDTMTVCGVIGSHNFTGEGSRYIEPTVEQVDFNINYRAGKSLITAIFLGKRRYTPVPAPE